MYFVHFLNHSLLLFNCLLRLLRSSIQDSVPSPVLAIIEGVRQIPLSRTLTMSTVSRNYRHVHILNSTSSNFCHLTFSSCVCLHPIVVCI